MGAGEGIPTLAEFGDQLRASLLLQLVAKLDGAFAGPRIEDVSDGVWQSGGMETFGGNPEMQLRFEQRRNEIVNDRLSSLLQLGDLSLDEARWNGFDYHRSSFIVIDGVIIAINRQPRLRQTLLRDRQSHILKSVVIFVNEFVFLRGKRNSAPGLDGGAFETLGRRRFVDDDFRSLVSAMIVSFVDETLEPDSFVSRVLIDDDDEIVFIG